jgi:hypothetical protein
MRHLESAMESTLQGEDAPAESAEKNTRERKKIWRLRKIAHYTCLVLNGLNQLRRVSMAKSSCFQWKNGSFPIGMRFALRCAGWSFFFGRTLDMGRWPQPGARKRRRESHGEIGR